MKTLQTDWPTLLCDLNQTNLIERNKTDQPSNHCIFPIYTNLHGHTGRTASWQSVNRHHQPPLWLQLWWSWLDMRHYHPDLQISSCTCVAAGLHRLIWPWSGFRICHFPAIFPFHASVLTFPLSWTSSLFLRGPFLSFVLFLCFYHAWCIFLGYMREVISYAPFLG